MEQKNEEIRVRLKDKVMPQVYKFIVVGEREELLKQIEEGEGSNLAIQQLTQVTRYRLVLLQEFNDKYDSKLIFRSNCKLFFSKSGNVLAGAPFRKPFYPNRRDDNIISAPLPSSPYNNLPLPNPIHPQQYNGQQHETKSPRKDAEIGGKNSGEEESSMTTFLPVEIATQIPVFAQYPRN